MPHHSHRFEAQRVRHPAGRRRVVVVCLDLDPAMAERLPLAERPGFRVEADVSGVVFSANRPSPAPWLRR
jgi:hypothetical protein